jgi:membrane-associated protease RseP (regulator of RpoE activity)
MLSAFPWRAFAEACAVVIATYFCADVAKAALNVTAPAPVAAPAVAAAPAVTRRVEGDRRDPEECWADPTHRLDAAADDDYVVDGKLFSSTSTTCDVVPSARIVPARKNGAPQGFQLFRIRPDSVYALLGIHDGDVITRVNGYTMRSPEEALEAYQRLRPCTVFDLAFERNGEVLHKRYRVDR